VLKRVRFARFVTEACLINNLGRFSEVWPFRNCYKMVCQWVFANDFVLLHI